ncbi:MAG: hypothetical protein ACT4PW_14225 [Acidimicrobiia bacterium]
MARSANDLSTADGRRVVRATSGFFRDLSRQLARQRPPHGRPPGSDFRVFELVRVVERFATGFDDLPELIPGRHDYRALRGTGTIVPRFVVVGQLSGDGSVELVEFSADDEHQ